MASGSGKTLHSQSHRPRARTAYFTPLIPTPLHCIRIRLVCLPPVVYLIGAGPGDPGLITVRGLACLAMADVVLYDHLVHPRLLAHAPTDAERIDVGTASPQAMAQEAICYLLAEKAREGKTVARLKWGDPFVFDRGGEEALFLHEQGVPFEVVPGIPAAIGIPGVRRRAAHLSWRRRHGHARARARGREPDGAADRLGQPREAQRHDRLLRRHAAAAGDPRRRWSPTDGPEANPAAVIYEGTLPGQQTVDGTLGELAELTRADAPAPSGDSRRRTRRRAARSTCAGSTIARCSDVASS